MANNTYDERYYLDDNNIYEREFLLNEQRFWNIREIYDVILYSSLIKEYDLYIDVARKLVNEINTNKDDLSKISTVMHLIRKGVFSASNSFIDKVPSIDIIRSKLGLNILQGSGCCRHFSSFINDIMPSSISLTCVGEVENPFINEANHVINKINYDGNIYGFDAFNGSLFEFISSFEMVEIRDEENIHLYYKPYAEVIFYKRSFEEVKLFLEQIRKNGQNKLSYYNLLEILLESELNVLSNKRLISDFKSETGRQLEIINEQIKEIKIKRLYA